MDSDDISLPNRFKD